MKKTQKEIIRDLNSYRQVFLDNAKSARKKYYLEEREFYRDLRFDEFLKNRSSLHVIEDILGLPDTKIEIVIYRRVI